MGKTLAILMAGVLAACAAGPSGTHGGEVVASNLARDTDPAATDADLASLAAGNRTFAADLYGLLARAEPRTNLFLSPYSISIALAMTYGGAAGATASQMAATMAFDLPPARLHPAFDALDLALAHRAQEVGYQEDGAPFQLSIADSIWGQQGFAFLPSFLDLLAVDYGAGMRLLDFEADPEGARQDINAWVADQTADRIPELLAQGTITDAVRLVLTNAIYFKASWADPFDKDQTADGAFHREDGTDVTVPLMHRYGELPYAEGDGWQAVAIPYVGDSVAMLVLVPAAGTFDAFESALDGDRVGAILADLAPRDGAVTLPRFGVRSSFLLGQALQDLGMVDAFDPAAADFSAMDGRKDLFVSQVVHQAFVAVDEAGTEAAAATAVIMSGSAAPLDPFDLAADRPFLFAVVDRPTGTILFLGRVLDASAP